jgi:DNA-binding CsgD family transcriptional regulator
MAGSAVPTETLHAPSKIASPATARREGAFAARAAAVLARTAELIEAFHPPAVPDGDLVGLGTQLSSAIDSVREAVRDPATRRRAARALAISELALDLVALADEARRRSADQRLEVLIAVQEALSHLRRIDRVADIIQRGPEEVVRTVGFDRAVIFRVEGSNLVAAANYFRERPEWAQQVLEFAQAHPARLDHMLLETEMIRRRAPMLVPDPRNDPRADKELVAAYQTRSYVAAPVMPHGRVIAFLHADRYFSERDVTPLDRDALWTFAEGFGYAVERTILRSRLLAQRREMHRLVSSAETVCDHLCTAELELAVADTDGADVARAAVSMVAALDPAAPRCRLDGLLTRRELEVLDLMANGETNASIAERLVISEGTVKSHVKHILRKMRAANRAEAVSRYMRILSGGTRPG